jgi:hypothetical protein
MEEGRAFGLLGQCPGPALVGGRDATGRLVRQSLSGGGRAGILFGPQCLLRVPGRAGELESIADCEGKPPRTRPELPTPSSWAVRSQSAAS